MANITASSNIQRKITSATAERRGEVICVVTSRGACTRIRQSTATMMMAWEDLSNAMPKNTMVTYSDPTATTAGMTACTPANTAIRKLCLNKTGCVIDIHCARGDFGDAWASQKCDKFQRHYQPNPSLHASTD